MKPAAFGVAHKGIQVAASGHEGRPLYEGHRLWYSATFRLTLQRTASSPKQPSKRPSRASTAMPLRLRLDPFHQESARLEILKPGHLGLNLWLLPIERKECRYTVDPVA